MRKFQQVALVVAATGGLSAIGVGPSFADAPVAYGDAAPPPAPRQGTQAAPWTASQATAHGYGSSAPQQQAARQQQAAAQQPAEVSPQVNPQVSPQLSPQISPQAAPQAAPKTAPKTARQTAPAQATPLRQENVFRPYQECSPQSLLNANLPVALLAAAETRGVSCTQANSQANAAASAR